MSRMTRENFWRTMEGRGEKLLAAFSKMEPGKLSQIIVRCTHRIAELERTCPHSPLAHEAAGRLRYALINAAGSLAGRLQFAEAYYRRLEGATS